MTVGSKPGQSTREHVDQGVAELKAYKAGRAKLDANAAVYEAREAQRVAGLDPNRGPEERGFMQVKGGWVSGASVIDSPTGTVDPVRVAKYEERQANKPPRTGSYALDYPSPVYSAFGQPGIMAHSSGWDTEPVRSFGEVDIYKHGASPTFYILGPEGQVATYQWNHKRLFVRDNTEESGQATQYPRWFDPGTVSFIKGMGGLTSDPFYSRRGFPNKDLYIP